MNTQPLATGLMIKLCCKYLSLRCMWRMMHVIIMLCTSFRENLYSMVCLNVKELLARNRCHIWSLSNNSEIWTHNHLICKRTLNCLAKLAKWLSCDMSTYLYGASDYVCCYHVTYEFQSESTLVVCLNVKELWAWSRHRWVWSALSRHVQTGF